MESQLPGSCDVLQRDEWLGLGADISEGCGCLQLSRVTYYVSESITEVEN